MSWKQAKIKLTPKICTICGKEFLSRAFNNFRCSKECRAKDNYKKLCLKNKSKLCLGCGKEFYPDNSNRKYCSLDCNYKHKYHRKELICPTCGVVFIRKNSTQKFCSKSCYLKYAGHRESSLEKELYEYLSSLKISFEKQKQIEKCFPDAFIPNINLCIFADGSYWHGKPEVIKRDQKITERLRKSGYLVIRLPENSKRRLDLEELRFMEKERIQ